MTLPTTAGSGGAGDACTGAGNRPGGGTEKVLRAVAAGPLGAYPLLEAAFCWNERRPVGWRRLGAASATADRQLPVAQTEQPAAAARTARLLSTITWSVTSPVGACTSLTRVEVSSDGYHRVLRALAGAWRDGRRMLGSPGVAAAHYPAALAVWRMAALLAPADRTAGVLAISVSTPAAALLRSAAPALALPHTVVERSGRSTVIRVDRPTLFRRLLTEIDPAVAGSGDGTPAGRPVVAVGRRLPAESMRRLAAAG